LEKLQASYEFKFRCEENRNYLKEYLNDCARAKAEEERAAEEQAKAALAELDIDLSNLSDRLVLKPNIKKPKKARKARDPMKVPVVRRKRENVFIAENSQVEAAAYVRKIVTTPEQTPEERRANKRKSKHVIIEDVLVENKSKAKKKQHHNSSSADDSKELNTKKKQAPKPRDDDEPIFEDDDDYEDDAAPKKRKRTAK